MAETTPDTNTTHVNQSTPHQAVLGLLPGIMALNSEQRQMLMNAWLAMDAEVSPGGLWQGPQASPSEVAQEAPIPPDDEEVFNYWFKSTQALSDRSQIEEFQAALDSESRDEYRGRIESAIAKVKNRNRLLSMELALTAYAYEKPFMCLIALLGIGAGVYKLGTGLFHLVF